MDSMLGDSPEIAPGEPKPAFDNPADVVSALGVKSLCGDSGGGGGGSGGGRSLFVPECTPIPLTDIISAANAGAKEAGVTEKADFARASQEAVGQYTEPGPEQEATGNEAEKQSEPRVKALEIALDEEKKGVEAALAQVQNGKKVKALHQVQANVREKLKQAEREEGAIDNKADADEKQELAAAHQAADAAVAAVAQHAFVKKEVLVAAAKTRKETVVHETEVQEEQAAKITKTIEHMSTTCAPCKQGSTVEASSSDLLAGVDPCPCEKASAIAKEPV
jgi:hypothetical protein